MEPAIKFQGTENLDSLIQEVSSFLENQEFPDFDSFLLCIDGELLEHLYDNLPWYLIFSSRKKVPRKLFKPPELFRDDFNRSLSGDWMHLKIYGVLENKALIGIQSPCESSSIPDVLVDITLTQFDKKPKWTFEKRVSP